jgi:hypothetical protein
MFKHNFLTYSGKIILQIIGEILYFPVWWYSVGAWRLLKNLWRFWCGQEEALGFSVWAKNILVPMYGQLDIASRVISFVMRSIQVVFRGIILIFWLALIIAVFIIWLALPIWLLIALSFQFWGYSLPLK